jgi:hypothetical protein
VRAPVGPRAVDRAIAAWERAQRIPVTTPARAILDLAATVAQSRLESLLDRVESAPASPTAGSQTTARNSRCDRSRLHHPRAA